MDSAGHHQHPRDRRHDERPVIDGWAKPAVLRRSTVRVICGVWLLLVVYGTLGPFGFGTGRWLAPAETWHWIPPAQSISLSSYNDVFTNLLVYIPVGVALVLLVRRRGGVRALELGLAMCLAVALSYVTELLQQFMPGRCADRGDLIVNSGAALLGCLIAPRAQHTIRRGHELAFRHWRSHPWLTLAWLMTGLTAVLMTIPWDLYWPTVEVQWGREFDLLDFRRFFTFVLLGFLITMAMIERTGRWPQAVGEALKRIFVCSVLFEAVQIFLRSHACGLLDMSTSLLGGMVGCGAARWLLGSGLVERAVPSRVQRLLASLVLLGMVALALITGLAHAGAATTNQGGRDVLWLPFQVHFFSTFDRVLVYGAESLFLYATLTMLCLFLTRGRGHHVALLLLVGLVGVVQTVRMHFFGAAADVTPLVLAVVAWLVAVRCWRAFVPRPARLPRGPGTCLDLVGR